MVNILVVEDDIVQRQNLCRMLEKNFNNINVYEAECRESANKLINKVKIDFFFIDINLKNSFGIDLALDIRQYDEYKLSWIVFITTHEKYMVEAFKKVHCYDYIIKPYNEKDIVEYTKLFMNDCKSRALNTRKKTIIESKGISIKLYNDDIYFVEIRLKKCTIHTIQGTYNIRNMTLKSFKELIDDERFVQSHRSYLVNKDKIHKIENLTPKSWNIYFNDYDKPALLGYKFKNDILGLFK